MECAATENREEMPAGSVALTLCRDTWKGNTVTEKEEEDSTIEAVCLQEHWTPLSISFSLFWSHCHMSLPSLIHSPKTLEALSSLTKESLKSNSSRGRDKNLGVVK